MKTKATGRRTSARCARVAHKARPKVAKAARGGRAVRAESQVSAAHVARMAGAGAVVVVARTVGRGQKARPTAATRQHREQGLLTQTE